MLTVRWMYEWVITALTHDQPSLFAICVCEQLDSFRQRRAFCFAQTSDQWTSRIQRPDSFRSTSIRFDKAFCFALKHPTSGPPVSTPVLDFRRQPTLDSRLCYCTSTNILVLVSDPDLDRPSLYLYRKDLPLLRASSVQLVVSATAAACLAHPSITWQPCTFQALCGVFRTWLSLRTPVSPMFCY